MEESTKRRERLRAMSLQASRAMVTTLEPSYSPLTVPPPLLLLPQISNSPIQPPLALECQPSISNSDFFITDPLSAFTSSKRMRGVGAIGFNSSSHGVGTIGLTPSTPYHPAPSSFPTGCVKFDGAFSCSRLNLLHYKKDMYSFGICFQEICCCPLLFDSLC
ncbi:uncharacterized protein LOC103988026 isoform X4 [Musa acuminata AAA Group]|uniref:uncharacterized protein LOC103988026 isoform X4 n=1 Tax=Musa acuminata AAA Group TaxID=214697 RepID=UPI0031E48A68